MHYSLGLSASFGLESNFKKRSRSLDEAQCTKKVTRCHKVSPVGVSWNKAASVGVDVSICESASIYHLNRNRVPKYIFCLSDTSETVRFVNTAAPAMAANCAPCTSGTKSLHYLSQQDIH
jgi:hypothetical protein